MITRSVPTKEIEISSAITRDIFNYDREPVIVDLNVTQELKDINQEVIFFKNILNNFDRFLARKEILSNSKSFVIYNQVNTETSFYKRDISFDKKKYDRFNEMSIEIQKNFPTTPSIKMIFENKIYLIFFNNKSIWENLLNKYKVSVVIPAYNEEKTIEDVVFSAMESELVHEVISVNDGSIDNTHKKLSGITDYKFKYIKLEENRGKGYAVAQGVKNAKGNIILMIDADLSNLKPYHIDFLVTPLFLNSLNVRATLGIRGLPSTFAIATKLTGERAYYKEDFIELLPEIEKTRYGIETILNYNVPLRNTAIVNLCEIKHPKKYDKGLTKSKMLKEYIDVISEIIYTRAKSTFK